MAAFRRRELIRRGAVVGGAIVGGGLLAACGGQAPTGARAAPGLTDLAASLEGELVLPSAPGYRAARLVWDSRFDGARPLAVARVASAADVAEVVDFARDGGVPLIVRGGGHSFAGYSTGDGLVLDLSGLDGVTADDGAEIGRIGAGATMLNIYRELWAKRRAISGGTCPTVGVTGLAAGGGLGVLSRRHGLTCDRLAEIEIVTADGRLRRASAHENPDLYWATRGGGGGNFGVITSLAFELVAVDTPFTYAEYELPWSAAEATLAAWQEWLPSSPEQTWSAVELGTQAPEGGAEPAVAVEIVHAGSEAEADSVVADLLGAIGARPVSRQSSSGPFYDIEAAFYCKGLRPKECSLAGKTPAGEFPRSALYSKSDVASGPWPGTGLGLLVEAIERRQRDRVLTPRDFDPAHTIGKVLIEAADGAVNSPAPDATAFVHRDNLFVAQYQSRWRSGADPDVVDANLAWADELYATVEPYRSGSAYQNYIDANLDDWERAYYGANLARLSAIKSRRDPGGLFSFAQSIPPAG